MDNVIVGKFTESARDRRFVEACERAHQILLSYIDFDESEMEESRMIILQIICEFTKHFEGKNNDNDPR